jgi:hypothetical protein
MATERVTTRSDGVTNERTVERDGGGPAYVERSSGPGAGAVIVGIALLALVAIVAFFLMNANHNDALRTDAVTSAASTVANSTSDAAKSVGNAADNAAGAVNPNR